MRELTLSTLRASIDYDAETGVFTRNGCPIGRVYRRGYIMVQLLGETYLAHRLAWFYVHGEHPTRNIDHINGVKSDNRIVNLRECNQSENQQNRRLSSVRGCYKRRNGRWTAQIMIGYRSKKLGTYDTEQQAREAYLAAKLKMHTFAPFGVEPTGGAANAAVN